MADDDKQEPDDEFERFENLTRELLKVPKSEVIARIAGEKAKGPQANTSGPEASP